jgi:hypothetical protein
VPDYNLPSSIAGQSSTGRTTKFSSDLPSAAGKLYQPKKSKGDVEPEEFPDVRPGSFNVNPLDPTKAAKEGEHAVASMFDGLRQALVGDNDDPEHSGAWLGGVPIVGDIGRAAANAIGGIGDAGARVIDTAGGVLERIPASGDDGSLFDEEALGGSAEGGLTNAFNNPALQQWLDEPSTEHPDKTNREVVGLEKADSLLGSGILSNEAHFQTKALRMFAEDENFKHPTLAPGAFQAPGSVADTLDVVMDVITVSGEWAAAKWAELDTPGQMDETTGVWRDRLDLIEAQSAIIGNAERPIPMAPAFPAVTLSAKYDSRISTSGAFDTPTGVRVHLTNSQF